MSAQVFSLDHFRASKSSRPYPPEAPCRVHWMKPPPEAEVDRKPGVMLLMFAPGTEAERQSLRGRPCSGVLLDAADAIHIAALFSHYPEPGAALPFEVSRAGVWITINPDGTDASGAVFIVCCGLIGNRAANYRVSFADRYLLAACRYLRNTVCSGVGKTPNVDVEQLLLYLDTRIGTLDLLVRRSKA